MMSFKRMLCLVHGRRIILHRLGTAPLVPVIPVIRLPFPVADSSVGGLLDRFAALSDRLGLFHGLFPQKSLVIDHSVPVFALNLSRLAGPGDCNLQFNGFQTHRITPFLAAAALASLR